MAGATATTTTHMVFFAATDTACQASTQQAALVAAAATEGDTEATTQRPQCKRSLYHRGSACGEGSIPLQLSASKTLAWHPERSWIAVATRSIGSSGNGGTMDMDGTADRLGGAGAGAGGGGFGAGASPGTFGSCIIVWDYLRQERVQTLSLPRLLGGHASGTAHFAGAAGGAGGFGAGGGGGAPGTPVLSPVVGSEDSGERLHRNQKIGEIISVQFFDTASVYWRTGQQEYRPSQRWVPCVWLLVLCEFQVAMVEIYSRVCRNILVDELQRVQPTAVEVLVNNLIAIGGADGCVRVWDTHNWVLVKTLQAHASKVVRILALFSDTSSFVTSTQNKAADDAVEALIKFMSFSDDGTVLLWESRVTGNIIEASTPTAKLATPLRGNLLAAHHDVTTDTLVTISTDRRVKLWDLKRRIAASEANEAQRAPKRMSLVGRGGHRAEAAATLRETDDIPLVGKISGSVLSRVNDCFVLEHPHYPRGTIVAAYKTNNLSVLKGFEGVGGEGSTENRSAKSVDFDGPMQRLCSVQDFDITNPLLVYAVRRDYEVLAHLAASGNVKVLYVQPHPLRPHLIAVITTAGVGVLCLDHTYGNLLASHPKWGVGVGLVFEGDTLQRGEMTVHNPEDEAFGGEAGDARATLEHTSDVFEFGEDSAVSAMIMTPSRSSGISSTLSSSPSIIPSPSGRYVAMVWPESGTYSVLEGRFMQSGQTGVEIDRGNCTTFGWVGRKDLYTIIQPGVKVVKDDSRDRKGWMRGFALGRMRSQDSDNEISPSLLVVKLITPDGVITTAGAGGPENPQNCYGGLLLCITYEITQKKRSRVVNVIEQKEEDKRSGAHSHTAGEEEKGDETAVIKKLGSQFFKVVYDDVDGMMSAASIRLEQVGPDFPVISKVAWDFTRAMCSALVGSRVYIMTSVPQFQVLTSVEVCTPLETLPDRDDVSSCPLCQMHWYYGSLFITTEDRILGVFPVWNKASAAVGDGGAGSDAAQDGSDSMSGDDNRGAAAGTANGLSASATDGGAKGSRSAAARKAAESHATDTSPVDVITIARLDATATYGGSGSSEEVRQQQADDDGNTSLVLPSVHGRRVFIRPRGFLEIVGVVDGHLVISGWDTYLHAVPILSPICAILINLTAGNAQVAAKWAEQTDPRFHDRIALMFAKRGFLEWGLRLPGVSWDMALEIGLASLHSTQGTAQQRRVFQDNVFNRLLHLVVEEHTTAPVPQSCATPASSGVLMDSWSNSVSSTCDEAAPLVTSTYPGVSAIVRLALFFAQRGRAQEVERVFWCCMRHGMIEDAAAIATAADGTNRLLLHYFYHTGQLPLAALTASNMEKGAAHGQGQAASTDEPSNAPPLPALDQIMREWRAVLQQSSIFSDVVPEQPR